MNRPFFKKQNNRGYIQKRPTTYRPIQNRRCVYKMCGETRTFHLCFGEGLSYNIQSAEDGSVQASIQKLQVIFACAESSRSSQTELAVLWFSSFSIFPTRLHELQLLMSCLQQQFLRSHHDRWSRISLWETNYRKYHNEQVFSFLLPILYSVSFQDYYPHQTCSFTSLNLEVMWRGPTLRNENSIQKWRNWRCPIHPRASCHPWQYSPVYCYSL